MDDIGDDLAVIWGQRIRAQQSVDERRKREARPMTTRTRRRAYMGEPKTAQLNFKVTASLRARIEALAIDKRCALVDVLEMAIDALEGTGQ